MILLTSPFFQAGNSLSYTMDAPIIGNDNLLQSPRPLVADYSSSEKEDVEVTIPDLFVSFLSRPLQVNPFYQRVKFDSDQWISK